MAEPTLDFLQPLLCPKKSLQSLSTSSSKSFDSECSSTREGQVKRKLSDVVHTNTKSRTSTDSHTSVQDSWSTNNQNGLVLGDNTPAGHFRNGLTDESKDKKNKKKNRITQIISGVNQKSKSDLFQKILKDMSAEEELISDYSCAFYRDILIHGRLYLSQTWLCFYANIIGWETLVTVQWCDVTAITKEKTAKLIPNAIQIYTSTDKYFFTTFVSREKAYTALFRIWQNALLGQPLGASELKALCRKYQQKQMSVSTDMLDRESVFNDNGPEVFADSSTSNLINESLDDGSKQQEKSSKLPDSITKDDYVEMSNSEFHPVINNLSLPSFGNSVLNNNSGKISEDKEQNVPHNGAGSTWNKAHDFLNFHKKKKRKLLRNKPPSYHKKLPSPDQVDDSTTDFGDESDEDAKIDDISIPCPCHSSHVGKEFANEEFDFDVDALFDHLFSQDSDTMKDVFEQRNFQDWKYTPLIEENGCKKQTLTYTVPLNYSIGPKQSLTESKQTFSKENKSGSFYVVDVLSTSFGIPYADSFNIATRYCLTRAAGNRSRLQVNGEILYTKKVFGLVKNMITRGTEDALKEYFTFLLQSLRSESRISPRKESARSLRKLSKTKSGKDSSKLVLSTEKTSKHVNIALQKQNSKINSPDVILKTSLAPSVNHPWLVIIVYSIIVLLILGVNIYLLVRLRNLENIILIDRPSFSEGKAPITPEEWEKLLRHQKILYASQLTNIHEFVEKTLNLVQQVEGSISAMHKELHLYSNELETT